MTGGCLHRGGGRPTGIRTRCDRNVPGRRGPGGGGRDHWAGAYCNLFAGAGIKEGAVIGRTDKDGGFPDERPVSPKDVLCTIYHLLGIDPHMQILSRDARPLPLVEGGEVMWDMLA